MVCLTTLQKLIPSEECQVLLSEDFFFFLAFLKLKLVKGKESVSELRIIWDEQNKHKWDTGWCVFTLYQVWNCRNLNSTENSQTLVFVRISGGFIQMQIPGPHSRALESQVLEWDPKTCISKKFPGNLMLLVPGWHFEKHWHWHCSMSFWAKRRWKSSSIHHCVCDRS